MPRKRNTVKTRAPISRIQEDPSLMHPFELVNYIQRPTFLSFVTSRFFVDLGGPVLYSTDNYDSYPYSFARSGLQPHPRIRELAEQEAEKHAQELIEEEKKSKDKAERNRRKKLRKKEKRLEKQNAVGAPAHEDGGSENHDGDDFTESDGARNGPADSAGTPTPSETAEDEERSEAGQEEETSAKTTEEEEEEVNSKQNPGEEERERRSRELAGIGYRLAASGQYETAVKYFTDAIKCDPKEFKLFGNRSLCYERMQQYESACRDADIALSLRPKWIKGLFRKGKALCGLKRYYEASLIYREVMELDPSSVEAEQELKQAQTLHLMEMGFSWAESSKALKTHTTMEDAIESLFNEGGDGGTENTDQAAVQEEDDDDDAGVKEDWITQRSSRHRAQRAGEPVNLSRCPSTRPRSGNAAKPKLFPVWAGVLAPSVTYVTLHQLFSRAGTVYSIKMLLEQQCAYVSYTNEEDCDRAVQFFNGMVVEGAPLTVRYPSPTLLTDPCRAKECFFWRTIGCTRSDCVYKHDPDHKGIDRDKFTGGRGTF